MIKYIIGGVLGVFLFFSCKKSENLEDQNMGETMPNLVNMTKAQYQTANIQLGFIQKKNISSELQVNGMLDVPPQNLYSVSTVISGIVKQTDLLQGMKVRKGQVIAVVQNPDIIQWQQEYLSNESKLKYLEEESKRQEALSVDQSVSRKVYQQANAEFQSLKAIQAGLKERLRLIGISSVKAEQLKSSIEIVSPIDGFVTSVNVNLGKFVNSQDIICEIIDTRHLHVELTVFEKDITKLKVGQKIKFNLVNNENLERKAKIYLINRKIAEDRTVRVHAHLDQEDPTLMPNMYVKALVEVGDQLLWSLPESAVVDSEGHSFVFILVPNTSQESYSFKAVEVRKGVQGNGLVEVQFLNDDDLIKEKVVLSGAYDLLSMMLNKEEE